MALTRHQMRLAGCGVIAALSLAVLFFHRPSVWAFYVAWTVSRIGVPLFILLSGVFSAGVVLTAFSRYRRKPELLAAALALSAALHMLLVAIFTLWVVGAEESVEPGNDILLEVAPGLPSSIEEIISRQMRAELLVPLERAEPEMTPPAPVQVESAEPAGIPPVPAPAPVAPDRAASVLEAPATAVAGGRAVDIGSVPASAASAVVQVDRHPLVTMRPIETGTPPEDAPITETRRLEDVRTGSDPLPAAEPFRLPAPAVPVSDRAVRLEQPPLPAAHTEPSILPDPPEAPAAADLEIVVLEVRAMPRDELPAAANEEVPSRDIQMELAVEPPPMNAPLAPLLPAMVPAMRLPPPAAAALSAPEALPDVPRRERPADPPLRAEPARASDAAVVSLPDRVRPAVVAPPGTGPSRPALAPAELRMGRTTAALETVTDVAARVEQPVPTTGREAVPGESLAADQAVSAPLPGIERPRLAEDTAAGAPARAESDPAETLRMQMALLRTLVSPTAETDWMTNAVPRELRPGRAAADADSPREPVRQPVPATVVRPSTVPSAATVPTLADPRTHVDYRETPRGADLDVDGQTGTRVGRDDLSVVVAMKVPSSLIPQDTLPADDQAVALPAPGVSTARRSSAASEVPMPAPDRPAAPAMPVAAADPARPSLAEAALPSATAGRVRPDRPTEGASSVAVAPADEAVMAVSRRAAALDAPAAAGGVVAGSPGRSESDGRLALDRAVPDATPMAEESVLPPLSPASSASVRTGDAVPQAMPSALPAMERRSRPAEPGRFTDPAGAGVAAAGVSRLEAEGIAGITVRPSALATAAAPVTPGESRTTAPVVSVDRATTGVTAVAPVARPAAPAMPVASAVPSDGSMAPTDRPPPFSVRAVPTGRAVGELTAAGASPMTVEPMAPVAGSMQPIDGPAGVLAPGLHDRGPGVAAPSPVALAVERAATVAMAGTDPSVGAPRPILAVRRVPTQADGTLADVAPEGLLAVTTIARGALETMEPWSAPPMDAAGATLLPLAVAAGTVASAPMENGEVLQGTRRTAAMFKDPGRASRQTRDDASSFMAPPGGWNPPPSLDRGSSGVRLPPVAESVAVRRVEASRGQPVVVAEPETVRRLMRDDVFRSGGAAGLKAIYELRSPEKRRLIEDLGGSPETEAAVEQALVWLAGAQSDDGRWDVVAFNGVELCGGAGDQADGNAAVTGLSLLAYLGAGYTHISGQHSETVRKGLEWLIEGQGPDGDLRRGGSMYDQAMATAALCESLSLTGDRRLLEPARLAAGFIMAAQTPEAAWRYEPRVDSDTSVLGWQVLALKSAEIAGVDVHPKHYAWSGMWLDQVRQGGGGLYAYKPGHGPTPVMTAEGWFCQLFMGEDVRRQGQEESIAYLLENLPEWNEKGRGTVHLYYWYYATLALRLSDTPAFDVWNLSLKRALLSGHRRDGPAAGSWDPVCQLGSRGGRIYATAMAALCLEVYYRYLPFYRRTTMER